jgi:hypothetical protein
LLTGLSAQNIKFYANSDASQVLAGSYFQVTFTLENANGKDFQAPKFNHFNVVSGPSRSSNISIVNGVRSQKLSYAYGLQAKKEGTYQIGPATVRANKKTYTTRPLTIKVLTANPAKAGVIPDEEFFLKAEIDQDTIYPGQQAVVSFKIFTSIGIESFNNVNNPDFPGFYAQALRQDSRLNRVVLDGREFTTKELRRVAIFPQKAGSYTIDPYIIRVGIRDKNAKGRRGFFSMIPLRYRNVQSNSVNITVVPYPQPVSDDFKSSVGRFEGSLGIDANKLSTDDVLSLRLRISGDGDPKRLQAPSIDLDPSFDVYDPKVITENTEEYQGRLVTEKLFEYLIVPNNPGVYQIAPSFTYLDVDSSRYIQLNFSKPSIKVTQGSNAKLKNIEGISNQAAVKEIRYLKQIDDLTVPGKSLLTKKWYWGIMSIPFLLIIGGILLKARQNKLAGMDPKLKRFARANKEALRRLKQAKIHLDSKEAQPFYDEVSRSLLGYVSDKLNMPAADLSKSNIHSTLVNNGIDDSVGQKFTSILSTCEMALFAGMGGDEYMGNIYEQALGLIGELEELLK